MHYSIIQAVLNLQPQIGYPAGNVTNGMSEMGYYNQHQCTKVAKFLNQSHMTREIL